MQPFIKKHTMLIPYHEKQQKLRGDTEMDVLPVVERHRQLAVT